MNDCGKIVGDVFGFNCLENIELALDCLDKTIEDRKQNKLSVKRFTTIYKELAELAKVLRCYSGLCY